MSVGYIFSTQKAQPMQVWWVAWLYIPAMTAYMRMHMFSVRRRRSSMCHVSRGAGQARAVSHRRGQHDGDGACARCSTVVVLATCMHAYLSAQLALTLFKAKGAACINNGVLGVHYACVVGGEERPRDLSPSSSPPRFVRTNSFGRTCL